MHIREALTVISVSLEAAELSVNQTIAYSFTERESKQVQERDVRHVEISFFGYKDLEAVIMLSMDIGELPIRRVWSAVLSFTANVSASLSVSTPTVWN
jgi:hypothetical protein